MLEIKIQKSLASKIIILCLCCIMYACAAQKAKKCGCPTFGDKKKKSSFFQNNLPYGLYPNALNGVS